MNWPKYNHQPKIWPYIRIGLGNWGCKPSMPKPLQYKTKPHCKYLSEHGRKRRPASYRSTDESQLVRQTNKLFYSVHTWHQISVCDGFYLFRVHVLKIVPPRVGLLKYFSLSVFQLMV